jgi:hypothetical protein
MNETAWRRPQSLEEVARETIAQETTGPGDFNAMVAEFLDEFYSNPSYDRIAEEPPLMAGHFKKAGIADVHLAAVAESMADRLGRPCPEWAEHRRMSHPCFAYDYPPLNEVLLRESPPAFRKRNLFVSENALSRA